MGAPVPESDLPSRVVPPDDLPGASPKAAPTSAEPPPDTSQFGWAMGGAYGGADPSLTVSDLGEMAKGYVQGPVDLLRSAAKSRFHVGTQGIEPPADDRAKSYRTLGEVASYVPLGFGAAPVAERGAQIGAKGLGKAVEVGERLLPGATAKAQKTISEIAQPSDISTLGSKMYKDLSGRLNALTTKRSLEANRLKDEYFKAGAKAEGDVLNDYKTSLLDALQKTGRDLSKDQREFVKTLLDRMEGNPSIQAIETERRYLRNIASGKLEGYEAIDKRFAGAMADKLEGILRKRVPESGRFIDSYAERSKPIDMFETTLGQKVSRSAGDFLPDVPKFDPATIPAAAFKTRHSLGLLKQLVDDDRAVDTMASEYVATQLKDLGAKDARAWLTKQEKAGWLDEVPAVKQETEDYIGRLEKVSHTQDKAKKALYGAAAAGALGGLEATYYRLKHMVGM